MTILKLKKYVPYIIPLIANALLFLVLFSLMKVYPPKDTSLWGTCFIITGAASFIANLTISISSIQIIEYFMYISYRIRKLFNRHYNKYDNPRSFKECHEFLSSDKFITMWFSYTITFAILITGIIIYITYVPPLEII